MKEGREGKREDRKRKWGGKTTPLTLVFKKLLVFNFCAK